MLFLIQFNLKVCCLFIHSKTVDSSLYFPPENRTFLFLASSLSRSGHFNLFSRRTPRDLESFSHSAGSLQDLCSRWPFCLQVQRQKGEVKVDSSLREKSVRGREPAEHSAPFLQRRGSLSKHALIKSDWFEQRGDGSRKRSVDIISSFDVVGSLCEKAPWVGVWRIVWGELHTTVMNF